MDRIESIPEATGGPVEGCELASRLSAYFDGELDPRLSARIEQHLPACPQCRGELDDIAELSVLANRIGASGMPAARLGKIHRLIDFDQGYAVLRIAGVLSGLAASALVIGSVWLSEIPPVQPQTFVVIPYADSEPMQVAVDLRVDPLPRTPLEIHDQQMFADAQLADWMLNGLSGRPR